MPVPEAKLQSRFSGSPVGRIHLTVARFALFQSRSCVVRRRNRRTAPSGDSSLAEQARVRTTERIIPALRKGNRRPWPGRSGISPSQPRVLPHILREFRKFGRARSDCHASTVFSVERTLSICCCPMCRFQVSPKGRSPTSTPKRQITRPS